MHTLGLTRGWLMEGLWKGLLLSRFAEVAEGLGIFWGALKANAACRGYLCACMTVHRPQARLVVDALLHEHVCCCLGMSECGSTCP